MHRIEAYIRLAIIFILIISILYIPILLRLKKKGKSVLRQLSYIGLFCSVFLIVFATILYVPITFCPETHILNVRPFQWIESMEGWKEFMIEKIPNIMLFVPLGFFVPIVWESKRKLYQTALLSFGITFCIEFFQYFIGRSADIDDIITNLLGAVIGYGIFKIFHYFLKQRKGWKKLNNLS